ncbi:MAG TPA: hypothetical protein VFW33_19475 [Gemmataceae bacterium]|nr:hypothetical protein [Gemmataceae bacterium]
MNRTPLLVLAVAVGLGLAPAALAQPAAGKMIAFSPIPQRVATADAVVVGKVTAIEDKTVTAEPMPGATNKVEYEVAVIKIGDGLLGTKGLTHVKVGMPKPPAGGRGIRPGGYGPPKLTVDQEGVFFLNKHPTESFYLLLSPTSVISKASNDNYEKELARVKECAKLLADPRGGLKSKDADERLLTAGLLVAHYRAWGHRPNVKKEDIDADESKLILKALGEADWTKAYTHEAISPLQTFAQLGMTEKDGWSWKPTPGVPLPPNAYADAAKEWVKSHADTYRIQRVVEEKKEK